MITVQFEVGTKHNSYTILIDGNPFCTTSNDDDGLKLLIAVEILKQRKSHYENPSHIISASHFLIPSIPNDL